jgi:ankyrin repeat protein
LYTKIKTGEKSMNRNEKSKNEQEIDSELLNACRKGNKSKVKELVENGANVSGLRWHGWEPIGSQGTTALCEADNVPIMQYLVEKGANVNEPDGAGNTPLVKAVHHLDVEKTRFLIENGANVDIYQHEVLAQTDLAGGYTGHREFPINCHILKSAFKDGIYKTDKLYEVVKILLEKIDSPEKFLHDPYFLDEAINYFEGEKLIELLINKGADVNITFNKDNFTPLKKAIATGNKKAIEVLLRNKAKVTKDDLKLAKEKDKDIYKLGIKDRYVTLKKYMKQYKIADPNKWW